MSKPKINDGTNARLLGGVKLAAKKSEATRSELERQVIRASNAGCSLRDIAKVAGFGSHHRVTEIINRAKVAPKPGVTITS